jgi:hypothetical protein
VHCFTYSLQLVHDAYHTRGVAAAGLQVLRGGVLYSQSFSRGSPTSSLGQQPAPAGAYFSGTKASSGLLARM